MTRLVFLLVFSTSVLSAVIYIDRVTRDSNKKVANFSVTFAHNDKRNAIVNLTIEIYKPLIKMMVYVKINVPENKDDRECKRQFLRTVVDVEKLSNGVQQNFLVAGYMENVKRFLDFEIQFPFRPVGISKFIFLCFQLFL